VVKLAHALIRTDRTRVDETVRNVLKSSNFFTASL
jgi:hypothetical protein